MTTMLDTFKRWLGYAPANHPADSDQGLTAQQIKNAMNPTTAANGNRILKGDGTWPFVVEVDGEDLVMRNVTATAFGGANDIHDNGQTASGVSTKANPQCLGCALPMHYDGKDKATKEAQYGSPIPGMPWFQKVRVTANGKSIEVRLIDRGPAKWAKDQIDLTVAAARFFDSKATANRFSLKVDEVRILGAAKYAPKMEGALK